MGLLLQHVIINKLLFELYKSQHLFLFLSGDLTKLLRKETLKKNVH